MVLCLSMINFNRYTSKAAEVIQASMQIASSLSHQAISPLHILLALVKQGGLIPVILEKLEIRSDRLVNSIKSELGYIQKVSRWRGHS